KVEDKIFQTFWEAIAKLQNQKEIQMFLHDLLSPTERTMLAKRLAIAALLLKGHTYESVMDILKVSNPTVAKVSLTLNLNPGYKIVINKIAKSEATREFWQDIGSAMYRISSPGKAFMPEGAIKHKLGHKKKTLV
ncbi:MAG: YerC/YecD family TrpR-related protein, partial [Candidatus Curtissbacteria bacterium]|nr:YerC/YecD family TrpR-related protein [Candidatus Curtissbacteria bacterium]